MRIRTIIAGIIIFLSVAWGREWTVKRDDSLPPSVKWYLEQRERHDWFMYDHPWGEQTKEPESLNVRLVGKWGRGPANRITGRDSLVFMSLGSEVAIFSASDGHHVRVVSEIQCRNITGRLALKDSFLFVGCNGPVEVYNIANPSLPRFVNRASVSGADLAVEDSLCYILGTDSLYIYNITNPANWQRAGACADSGYALNVADGFAYVSDRWGLYIVDATNPKEPKRASVLSGGRQVAAAWVEGSYCYYTEDYPTTAFVVASISDPYHPSEVGRRTGLSSWDIHKRSFFVYLADFTILDVSQSQRPTVISSLALTGNPNGIWTKSPYSLSFVASGSEGLAVIDVDDPVHPALDTMLVSAGLSQDICIEGDFAYAANNGMKIIQVTGVPSPVEIGSYDTTGGWAPGLRVRDSLAYVLTEGWNPFHFRVVNIASHRTPFLMGGCLTWNPGVAVALRDSLVYVAEDYKLEIFSIANPRNPRLVGSCGLPNSSYGICVRDTLAYVANLTSLKIINVANPTAPAIVGSCAIRAVGVSVRDTLAFVAGYVDGFYSVNVTHATAPFVISNLNIPSADVVAQDSLVYLGADRLYVIDVKDPADMRQIGFYQTPYWVRKVFLDGPLIYTCCYGAGVCILETTSTTGVKGNAETRDRAVAVSVFPNPTAGILWVNGDLSEPEGGRLRLYDAAGRRVLDFPVQSTRGASIFSQDVDMHELPCGTYFLSIEQRRGKSAFLEVIKVDRR